MRETGLMKRRAALGAALALPLVAMVGLAGCAQRPGSEFVGNWRRILDDGTETAIFVQIGKDDQGLHFTNFQFGWTGVVRARFVPSATVAGQWEMQDERLRKNERILILMRDGYLILKTPRERGDGMREDRYRRYSGDIPGAAR